MIFTIVLEVEVRYHTIFTMLLGGIPQDPRDPGILGIRRQGQGPGVRSQRPQNHWARGPGAQRHRGQGS